MPPACLASLSGGAGAALDDKTDYDDAGFDDDGPTRPPRILHGRGNNWPITAQTGLDMVPAACLASLSGGAGAAINDETDHHVPGFGDDNPPRRQHGRGNNGPASVGLAGRTPSGASAVRDVDCPPDLAHSRWASSFSLPFPSLPPSPTFTHSLPHTHTQHLHYIPHASTHPTRTTHTPGTYTNTHAHAPLGAAQLCSIPELLQHIGL